MNTMCNLFTLTIQIVQLLGKLSGMGEVFGGQKFESSVGRVHPPGSIQAGSNCKTKMAGIEFFHFYTGCLDERIQALTLRFAHKFQTGFDHRPIFTIERSDVDNCADANQIKPLAGINFRLWIALQVSLNNFKSNSNPSQHFIGVKITLLVWVDDRICLRDFFAGEVMIADYHFHTQLLG